MTLGGKAEVPKITPNSHLHTGHSNREMTVTKIQLLK